MIMKIYSIRDNAVEAFLQPFFSATTNSALRAVKEAVNDPKHDFHKHAADYSIWDIAEFDDATGVITPNLHGPVRILGLVDLLGLD